MHDVFICTFFKKIKVWNNKKWHMAAINEIWSSLKSVVGLPSYWNWHLSVSPQFPRAALEKQTLHRLHCLSLQTSPLPSSPCPAHTGLLQNLVLPRGLHTCCSLCLEHWPPEPPVLVDSMLLFLSSERPFLPLKASPNSAPTLLLFITSCN